MADRDLQPGFVGQLLQFPPPQPHACAVTPPGVGGDRQASRFWIGGASHPAPPTIRFHQPSTGEEIAVESPLPGELEAWMVGLEEAAGGGPPLVDIFNKHR